MWNKLSGLFGAFSKILQSSNFELGFCSALHYSLMGAARAGCFVGTEVEFGPSIIATLSEPLLTLQNLSAHCVCNISSSSSPHTPILCCAIKPKQQRANAKQENTGETATFPICININFAGHVCFFCVYSLTVMIFDTQPFGRKNYYIKKNMEYRKILANIAKKKDFRVYKPQNLI